MALSGATECLLRPAAGGILLGVGETLDVRGRDDSNRDDGDHLAAPTDTLPVCPHCGDVLAGGGDFVAWCRSCEWNLQAGQDKRPESRVRRWQRRVSHRSALRLFRSLEGKPVPRPGWDVPRVVSYAMALVVHALSFGLIAAGAWIILVSWGHWWPVAMGLFIAVVGVGMRPRLGRLPKDARVLSRADAPHLYRLLDQVAAHVGASPADVVVVDDEMNASYGTVGLRRRRVVTIGLPLWTVLEPQERVALLGHEFGHGRNGDARHGLVVGTALETLGEWYDALRIDAASSGGDFFVWLAQQVADAVSKVFRGIVLAWIVAMDRLMLRSSQRAEYLADVMSAQAGSTAAANSLLRMLLVLDSVHFAHVRAANRGETALWDAGRAFRDSIPEAEWERRLRLAERKSYSVDTTHPATILRMRLVESRDPVHAGVALDAAADDAIAAELAEHEREVARALAGELRAAAY